MPPYSSLYDIQYFARSELAGNPLDDANDLAQLAQPCVVLRMTLQDIAPEYIGRPPTELHATLGLHAVAHRDNDIKAI